MSICIYGGSYDFGAFQKSEKRKKKKKLIEHELLDKTEGLNKDIVINADTLSLPFCQ